MNVKPWFEVTPPRFNDDLCGLRMFLSEKVRLKFDFRSMTLLQTVMADDENFLVKFFITKLDEGLTTVVGLFTFSPIISFSCVVSRLFKIIILLISYFTLIVDETKKFFLWYFFLISNNNIIDFLFAEKTHQ